MKVDICGYTSVNNVDITCEHIWIYVNIVDITFVYIRIFVMNVDTCGYLREQIRDKREYYK